MQTKIFFTLVICLFLLTACHKPNPHPETLDPIYSEIQKELTEAEHAVNDEVATLAEHEAKLKLVVPQTGQIKYAQKRYNESKARLAKLRQQALYLKLHLQSRKDWDHSEYIKAFRNNQPWPDPQEYADYKAMKKALRPPRPWSAQKRMEELGIQTSKQKKQEPAGGPPNSEAAKTKSAEH